MKNEEGRVAEKQRNPERDGSKRDTVRTDLSFGFARFANLGGGRNALLAHFDRILAAVLLV